MGREGEGQTMSVSGEGCPSRLMIWEVWLTVLSSFVCLMKWARRTLLNDKADMLVWLYHIQKLDSSGWNEFYIKWIMEALTYPPSKWDTIQLEISNCRKTHSSWCDFWDSDWSWVRDIQVSLTIFFNWVFGISVKGEFQCVSKF